MQLFEVSHLQAGPIPCHRHVEPYATLVLRGRYEEAGSAGRFVAEPGQVIFHQAFSFHRDAVLSAATSVIDLPLPFDGTDWPARGEIADADRLAILCGQDRGTAVDFLMAHTRRLAAAEGASEPADRLATALRNGTARRIGEWAAARKGSREHLSRSFERLYGVPPRRYRAECQAFRAWQMIVGSDETLAGVASGAGYADQAHMSRSISRMTGRTPLAWRRTRSERPTEEGGKRQVTFVQD